MLSYYAIGFEMCNFISQFSCSHAVPLKYKYHLLVCVACVLVEKLSVRIVAARQEYGKLSLQTVKP